MLNMWTKVTVFTTLQHVQHSHHTNVNNKCTYITGRNLICIRKLKLKLKKTKTPKTAPKCTWFIPLLKLKLKYVLKYKDFQ